MSLRQRLTQAGVLAGIVHGGRAFVGPYEAGLWLSNRCNLRCIHCYFYSPLAPEPNYFEVRAARQGALPAPSPEELRARRSVDADAQATTALIDDLVGMGTWLFHFGGAGEPLLHPEGLEFMARVKHAGRACCMNTNGTLLEPGVIDELVRMGFDELRLTTMAGTAELYQTTHPGSRAGTFERLRENLLVLVDRRAAAGAARPRLTLVCVVVRQNCEGLTDFARFAREVKADSVALFPVGDGGDPHMAPLLLTQAQVEGVRKHLPQMARLLKEAGIGHNLPWFSMVLNRRRDTAALYRIIPCYVGWLAVQILAEGDVHACCQCSLPLGNVRNTPMPVLWHGAAYNAFRRAARRINRCGEPLAGCACGVCANSGANLRIFRALHPLSRRRLRALERQSAILDGEAE